MLRSIPHPLISVIAGVETLCRRSEQSDSLLSWSPVGSIRAQPSFCIGCPCHVRTTSYERRLSACRTCGQRHRYMCSGAYFHRPGRELPRVDLTGDHRKYGLHPEECVEPLPLTALCRMVQSGCALAMTSTIVTISGEFWRRNSRVIVLSLLHRHSLHDSRVCRGQRQHGRQNLKCVLHDGVQNVIST